MQLAPEGVQESCRCSPLSLWILPASQWGEDTLCVRVSMRNDSVPVKGIGDWEILGTASGASPRPCSSLQSPSVQSRVPVG